MLKIQEELLLKWEVGTDGLDQEVGQDHIDIPVEEGNSNISSLDLPLIQGRDQDLIEEDHIEVEIKYQNISFKYRICWLVK